MFQSSVWWLIVEHFGFKKIAKNMCLLINDLFKTNYSKPLRQPYAILTYRVYLKPLNSILNFRKVRKKNGLDFWKNTFF